MIGLLALVAAVATQPAPTEAAQIQGFGWEGTGEVYPPGRTIKLGVRTRINGDRIVSESWPLDQGEAKGMHRMVLDAHGGKVEIGGKSEPVNATMHREERAQFGIYTQLQAAVLRGPELARLGVNSFSIEGPVRTWFRIDSAGQVIGALNQVPVDEGGGLAHQTFRFDGWLRSNGMVFPRHMEMTRDGKPFFTLDVTRFDVD